MFIEEKVKRCKLGRTQESYTDEFPTINVIVLF